MCIKLKSDRRRRSAVMFVLVLALVIVPVERATWAVSSSLAAPIRSPQPSAPVTDVKAAQLTPQQTYAKVGLTFEPNQGQTDDQVHFLAHGAGYTVFLTSNEAVFALRNGDCGLRNQDAPARSPINADPLSTTSSQLTNCNQQTSVLRSTLVTCAAIPMRQDSASGRQSSTSSLVTSGKQKWLRLFFCQPSTGRDSACRNSDDARNAAVRP